jgi:fructose-bisphosphate aldolase class I
MSSTGQSFVDVLKAQGILTGIKVDTGAHTLARCPEETVTEGLDGLRDRLSHYRDLGARFAKWRAVIRIADGLPSATCVDVNAHALARYAALCQEQDLVPIVEPEVLIDGAHTLERCGEVTADVLKKTFVALIGQRVNLEGMLLKPNMILSGKQSAQQSSTQQVAFATVRCLGQNTPNAVPGVVFLSGGQDPLSATAHLNAINVFAGPQPWKLSFSFGRALQEEALQAWHGWNENSPGGQEAFWHRAKCASAAAMGKYNKTMEDELAA